MAAAQDSQVLLFGKWSYDVSAADETLNDYIAVSGRSAVYTPHTAGRYQKKRFHKALCPIVERFLCCIMGKGRNTGKKLTAMRVIQQAFEMIHQVSGANPLQILVDAVANGGAREDSTRIGSGGVVRRQAVDVSPMRRVNQALTLMTQGARKSSFRNIKSLPECIADEIMNCAKNSMNSAALKKKDEVERVARANR